MSGYREVSRVDLVDSAGVTLSLIVETNDVSFKLYGCHRRPDQSPGEARYSDWWSFTKLERALDHQQQKVDEAVAKGWRVSDDLPEQ